MVCKNIPYLVDWLLESSRVAEERREWQVTEWSTVFQAGKIRESRVQPSLQLIEQISCTVPVILQIEYEGNCKRALQASERWPCSYVFY